MLWCYTYAVNCGYCTRTRTCTRSYCTRNIPGYHLISHLDPRKAAVTSTCCRRYMSIRELPGMCRRGGSGKGRRGIETVYTAGTAAVITATHGPTPGRADGPATSRPVSLSDCGTLYILYSYWIRMLDILRCGTRLVRNA